MDIFYSNMPKRKRSQEDNESNGFRARRLCFTAYTEPKLKPEEMDTDEEKKNRIRYFVYQKELCPKTQRIHWQGYIEFHAAVRQREAQSLIGVTNCHIECAKGTWQANEKYCTKEGRLAPPVTWGNMAAVYGRHEGEGGGGGNGNAQAVLITQQVLQNPQISDQEIAEIAPGELLRHYSAVDQLRTAQQLEQGKRCMRNVYVEVIWGDPGTGKTWTAFRKYWGKIYPKNASSKWWCGYQGEPVILIDEFTGSKEQLSVTEMNKIMDIYPYMIEKKGKTAAAMWTHVVIISNLHPAEWYDKWKGIPIPIQNAFMSRIRSVTKVEGQNRRIEREAIPEPCVETTELPPQLRGESQEREENAVEQVVHLNVANLPPVISENESDTESAVSSNAERLAQRELESRLYPKRIV